MNLICDVGVDPCINPGKGEHTSLRQDYDRQAGSPLHDSTITPFHGRKHGFAPTIVFWMVFFVITLAPVLQIIPLHEIVALHYLYVPVIGFCAVVGVVVDKYMVNRETVNRETVNREAVNREAVNREQEKSRITHHPSPITYHASPVTHHASRITHLALSLSKGHASP